MTEDWLDWLASQGIPLVPPDDPIYQQGGYVIRVPRKQADTGPRVNSRHGPARLRPAASCGSDGLSDD